MKTCSAVSQAINLSAESERLLNLDRLEAQYGISQLNVMPKHPTTDKTQIMRRSEELINASSNRYRVTVQVANRAKKRSRHDAFEDYEDPMVKSVMQAIVEMSEELTQPEIIGD